MLIFLLIILQLQFTLAKPQNGLPHEVLNITQGVEGILPGVMTANQTITEPVRLDLINLTTTETWSSPTTTRIIHSIIFPSPDASPVEITAQSQVITSYVPEMTWCVGPAIAISPVAAPPFPNGTTNFTQILEGTGSCDIKYSPIATTVCATTLTGLASKVTITACDQEVTFSSECGYSLETPTPITTNSSLGNSSLVTPAPTIKSMYTFWLAPWQALTAGEPPSDVDVKICTVLDNDDLECMRYQEVWEVVVITQTVTTERTIQFSTTVSGPGTLLVETLQTTITDTVESIDLSTILLLETDIEIESTRSDRKPVGTVQSTQRLTSTKYITKQVLRRPTARYDHLEVY